MHPSNNYETLRVIFLTNEIANVQLNRPKKLNAMNLKSFFDEVKACFRDLSKNTNVRAIIISSSNDSLFCAGLDLMEAQSSILPEGDDIGRKGLKLLTLVKHWQRCFDAIQECHVPVISVVSGACIGGGVDLISVTDIRICSNDAYFSVKEVDIAMAADLGTLQRLPKIVGNKSLVYEWCFTGRKIPASEALSSGLVSHVSQSHKEAMTYAVNLAKLLASKSPLAIAGIKNALNYAQDHSVADGLTQVATWNASMLQSKDILEAISSKLSKKEPRFSKL